MSINETQRDQLFNENSWWLKAFLVIMFLLAALLRRDEIRAPGHLLDREYTSAIFARAYYFMNNDNVETWQRDIAITEMNQQPILEPPLLEYMVSLIYRIMGREEIYYSRYLTSAFWLIGGVFLLLTVRKLLSIDEAVIATGYYLFAPWGVVISRSFQPDSLMMMMFLISLYALVLYFETPTTKRLLASGILTGITLLLRPLVLFSIFFSFLAFSFHRNKSWKKLIDLPLVIFSTVSLLPFLAYYGYGILFAGFMRWKVPTSFMPFLLVKRDFWLGWFENVVSVAEFMPLLLAMVGFFLLRDTKVRYWIIGLVLALLVFGVVFTYHTHTHLYYLIQFFPIVGLCMAPSVTMIIKSLMQSIQKYWWIPVAATFLLSLWAAHRDVRGSFYHERLETPTTAWEIGEIVHHSPHTVYVSFYYGVPLVYHGQFGGAPWPVKIEEEFYRWPNQKELSVRERIDGLGFKPEYFIVTNFYLYDIKHQDLKQYLEHDCDLLAENERYLIYFSCSQQASGNSVDTVHQTLTRD